MDQKTRVQISVLFPITLAIIVILGIWALLQSPASRAAPVFLAALFGVIALIMSGILYLISRSFSHRINLLEQGAIRAKSGNADPIVISGSDEVAQVSQVLNDMTREVRAYLDLTKKHTELKAELEEVQQVAESLRHTNMDLSDSLERLKRAQEQILHKEHMHLLLPMLSGITHDFNEGLTAILALTEFVREHPEKLETDQQVKRWYGAIETIAHQAREKVRALTEWAQPMEAKAELLRIRDVVEKAIRVTQPKWEQEAEAQGAMIKIETEYHETETIQGVETDLVQMLTHIIVNAVEAMPKGGTITIRTANAGDGVNIQVQDTGVGMEEKVLERAFRPFFSTKEGAAGVGLAIVKGIIQQHGGKIGLASKPGEGTSVYVDLPAKLPEPPKPQPEAPELKRKLNILLVEDDQWTMDFIAESLRGDGHKLDTARDGIEGLEKYRSGKYELVITDRAMPMMNGDELARIVKRTYPYEPVIMLTGFGEIMKGKGECPPFVDAVVSKPVKVKDLEQAMAYALLKQGQSVV